MINVNNRISIYIITIPRKLKRYRIVWRVYYIYDITLPQLVLELLKMFFVNSKNIL